MKLNYKNIILALNLLSHSNSTKPTEKKISKQKGNNRKKKYTNKSTVELITDKLTIQLFGKYFYYITRESYIYI